MFLKNRQKSNKELNFQQPHLKVLGKSVGG